MECKERKPPEAFSVRAATGNLFAKCKQCSRQACRSRWDSTQTPAQSTAARAVAAGDLGIDAGAPVPASALQSLTAVCCCLQAEQAVLLGV